MVLDLMTFLALAAWQMPDNLARFLGIARPVNVSAASRDVLRELVQVLVEVVDHVALDLGGGVAGVGPGGVAGLELVALEVVAAQRLLDQSAVLEVSRHHAGVVVELLHRRPGAFERVVVDVVAVRVVRHGAGFFLS